MSILPLLVNFNSLAVKPLPNVDLFVPFVSNIINKLVSAEGFAVGVCPQFAPSAQSQVLGLCRTDSCKYQSSADAAKADRAKIAVNVVFFSDFFIENKNPFARILPTPPPPVVKLIFSKNENFSEAVSPRRWRLKKAQEKKP